VVVDVSLFCPRAYATGKLLMESLRNMAESKGGESGTLYK
jgi:hypothetical protein